MHKILLHCIYTGNTTAVQNTFRARFPHRSPPHQKTILRNLAKYSNEGTTLNLNKFSFMHLSVWQFQQLCYFKFPGA